MRYAIHKQPDMRRKWVYVVVDYEHPDREGKRPVQVGEFKTKAQAEKWIDKQSQ